MRGVLREARFVWIMSDRMGDNLAGIEEDVPFDWAGAQRLAAELRAAATTLDAQIPDRNAYASDALVDWRGVFSQQFGTRMTTCTTDSGRLATAMELAADQVDELARLAREEQDRREAAREWKRQQDNEGFLDKVGDSLFGEDDLPPIPPPVEPPTYTAEPHMPPGRE
jgi:hypothetical protein